MSKRVFNPYRDMLDIPSLTDENPTDYQLLGVKDFESDSEKIAAAYEKRSQRIADLYQTVTEMSKKIDAARDRISDPKVKEAYDYDLCRMGRAGVVHLGIKKALVLLFVFVFSIFTVIVTTFYIYPMVVTVPSENIGDSVTTIPEYQEAQTQKEIDDLKVKQEDITTMDVNYNMPIDVDVDTSVEFLDVPAADIPGEVTTVDDLSVPDSSAPLDQPAAPETPAVEDAAPEEPAAPETPAAEETTPEEPAAPEMPAVEETVPEEPAAPETPAAEETVPEEPAAPETPAVEDAAPEEPAAPETPAVEETVPEEPAAPETPEVEQTAPEEPLEQDKPTIEKPSEDEPEIVVEPLAPEDPAPIDSSPSDNHSSAVLPAVPKVLNMDDSEIPELPPLDDVALSDSQIAPAPPVIPELSAGAEPAPNLGNRELGIGNSNSPAANLNTTPHSLLPTPSTRPSGVVLEDVDLLEQIVLLGQKARTDADFAQLLSSARQVEADLVKKKDFQKAQQIADVVYETCARSANKAYRSEALRYKDFISKRAAWWKSVRLAQEKMDENGTVSPTDADLAARWRIEIENDWENGLKFLALSENEQVRNAAQNEIAVNQEDVRSVLVVANNWWNLAQNPVPMQKQFRAHASEWYAKALPSITDKQIRTLIEKRIEIAEQGYLKH